MLAGLLGRCALCALSVGVLWQALGTGLAGLVSMPGGSGPGPALARQLLGLVSEAGQTAAMGGETLLAIGAGSWALAVLARWAGSGG